MSTFLIDSLPYETRSLHKDHAHGHRNITALAGRSKLFAQNGIRPKWSPAGRPSEPDWNTFTVKQRRPARNGLAPIGLTEHVAAQCERIRTVVG